MRVWIDLSNSPHPLLFEPVARRLAERGHEVVVTMRDNAQTVALTQERWPHAEQIGGQSPPGRLRKAGAMAGRVAALARWARRRRPEVALSHNSYGQICAARALRLPVVTAMDYEHQPANHLAFRLAHAVLLPAALPLEAVAGQGATERKARRYPGLKEEIYLGEFRPESNVLEPLGIERRNGDVLVVTRPPPSRAAYHRFGNPLYDEALRRLTRREDVVCVALARHPEQVAALRELPRVVVPDTPVESRSLMYCADVVIGAGGTMTREAALLGVPTLSAFAGRPAAVDRELEERGALARLTDPAIVDTLAPRGREPASLEELARRGRAIVDVFVAETERVAA